MQRFSTSPSLASLYARVLFSRKPSLVPSGHRVPRIEATLDSVRIDAAHLAHYRALTAWTQHGVPLTYPHVLASGLHLAMLSSREFPVRLLGLVHLANRIEQREPLKEGLDGTLVATLEGHRETERGQEFELHTELHCGNEVPWREVSTFLARKKRSGPKVSAAKEARPPPTRSVEFVAPAGLGREYGRLAGDLNPIHVSDLTAKLFGFPHAIAHGMWSLARCAAELDTSRACALAVQFKLPVFLPSRVLMEVQGEGFGLYDAKGERPHLAATVTGL